MQTVQAGALGDIWQVIQVLGASSGTGGSGGPPTCVQSRAYLSYMQSSIGQSRSIYDCMGGCMGAYLCVCVHACAHMEVRESLCVLIPGT